MKLDKYIAISGLPGIHKIVASRNNGVIIDDRQEKRVRFIPNRGYQLSPLAGISVYTYTEAEGEGSIMLADVFQKMLDAIATTPAISPESPSQDLRGYFAAVMPEHDQERVHIKDIKKCLKWFHFMKDNGIFEEAIREEEAEKAAEADAEQDAVNTEVETVNTEEKTETTEAEAETTPETEETDNAETPA